MHNFDSCIKFGTANYNITQYKTLRDMQEIINMTKAAVQYGHRKNVLNPAMNKYLFDCYGGVYYFDLNKTLECLKTATEKIKELKSQKKNILVVGTKFKSLGVIEKFAKDNNFIYVSTNWIPGLLTNFKTISARINEYNQMREDYESGKWERQYTKKEVKKLLNALTKLEVNFEVLADLKKVPDALLVLDTINEKNACIEAKSMNIPVFGILDANSDPNLVNYPIPANDDSINSVNYVLQYIADNIK